MILNTDRIRKYSISPKWFKKLYIDSKQPILAKNDLTELPVSVLKSLEDTLAYKSLEKYKSDVTVTDDDLSEHIDYYNIEDGVCTIVNIKTSDDVLPGKWQYECVYEGYFMEFALQGLLLGKLNKEIKEIKYKHIVVQNSYPNSVEVYEYDPEVIRVNLNAMIAMIKMIREDKDFKKHEVSLDKTNRIPRDFLYPSERKEIEDRIAEQKAKLEEKGKE